MLVFERCVFMPVGFSDESMMSSIDIDEDDDEEDDDGVEMVP